MKNKFFIFLFFLLNFSNVIAEDLLINSKNIKIDKKKNIVILSNNVEVKDEKNNKITTFYANYNKNNQILITEGETIILTSEGYKIVTANVFLDNSKGVMSSDEETKIEDLDGNEIFLDMFSYNRNTNIIFSKGNINILDINKNEFIFSELYVDEKKRKIVGSEIKAFFNDISMKDNEANEPRLFGNSISIAENKTELSKGIFTFCKNRGKDKCPPWSIKAKKISHDNLKKTIFYDSATLQIYDIPIFFFPKFSHPDPTVDRRSGLLAPKLSNSSTIGSGVNIPYFWAISDDRDFTITPRIYSKENPILFTEYRQEFSKASFLLDASYTKGYKNTSFTKSKGSRNHVFSSMLTNFSTDDEVINNLEVKIQKVSNPTYLKVHNVKTLLADNENNILENTLGYEFSNDNFSLGLNFSAYEDLEKTGNKRYEYLLPSLNFEKNLFTDEKLGSFDLNTTIDVRNYDANKQTEFLVNDVFWDSKIWKNSFGLKNSFKGLLKGVNYNSEKASGLKNDQNNTEVKGAIAYQGKVDLMRKSEKRYESLAPKFSLRYSPYDDMRKIDSGERLKYSQLYNLKKTNEIDVIENGLSLALGFDYRNSLNEGIQSYFADEIKISMGQIINENESEKMNSKSSLDQRFSDIVGETNIKVNENIDLSYNFSLDQNYKDFNYSEAGFGFQNKKIDFNIKYLEERKHIGNNEHANLNFGINLDSSNQINFETKRDLIKNSADFYNLSYNYLNDCLKASLAYRREFYTDRDVEPNNSLMFTISIVPFSNLTSSN